LSHLVSMVPTSLHIEYYGQIVSRLAVMRRLISAGSQITALGYGDDAEIDVALSKAQDILFKVGQQQKHAGLVPVQEVADGHVEDMIIWLGSPDGTIRGLSTGFRDLDQKIDGLEKGTLYLVAARPSVGKTMLCLNIAKNLAWKGVKVGIFSLEQNRKKILERMVFAEARLNRFMVRHSDDFGDKREFWEAWGIIAKLPIEICDTAGLKSDKAISETMAKQLTTGLDVVVFDYIGLAGDEDDSEVRRIGMIVKNLKRLARLCDIPVIAACQLNRALEARADKKPGLADLRDSGELEQTGDVVIGLYRDELYEEDTKKPKTLECCVLKNRDGPTGRVELYYDASTGFMADLVKVK